MGLKSLVLLLNKTTHKTFIFLKKYFFTFLEPQNREVIESYYKASLNFSRLKGTYLGKTHFNIIIKLGRQKKMKLKSDHI